MSPRAPVNFLKSPLPIILFISILFFAFSSFLPSLSQALAATYCVDATNGNDSYNGLTTTNAWKTINKVNTSTFNPGDQILFKRGEVWGETLIPPSSGTAENLITFGAFGTGALPAIYGSEKLSNWTLDTGDTYLTQLSWECKQVFQNGQRLTRRQAIEDLTNGSWYQDPATYTLYIITTGGSNPGISLIEASKRNHGIYLYGKSYVKVEGFTLLHANGPGTIYLGSGSSNNEIKSCNISYGYGNGILIEDYSDGNTIAQNSVSFCHYGGGNYQFYSSNGIMIRYASGGNQVLSNEFFSNYGSGIFVSDSSNNLIEKNIVYENGAGGIDINDPGSSNNLVSENTVYRNGQIDTDEQGISFFRAGTGNVARGNTVYEQQGGPNDGIGILIDTTVNQVIIKRNTVYSNSGHGLAIWNSQNGILRNNTSYGNSKNGIFVGGKDSVGAQVVNNISVNNNGYQLSFQPDAVAAGGYIVSHNNFYKPGSQKVIMFNDRTYTAADFNAAYPGSNILQGDPIFVSPVNNFSLSPTSPCIDSGKDVGLSFMGRAPDLGAYEYDAPSQPLVPPRNLRFLTQ